MGKLRLVIIDGVPVVNWENNVDPYIMGLLREREYFRQLSKVCYTRFVETPPRGLLKGYQDVPEEIAAMGRFVAQHTGGWDAYILGSKIHYPWSPIFRQSLQHFHVAGLEVSWKSYLFESVKTIFTVGVNAETSGVFVGIHIVFGG